MSYGNCYILVTVDYISKWMEATTMPMNDTKVIVRFLKRHVFTYFGIPRALISDEGSYFHNYLIERVLKKYNVTYKIATLYYPSTNGQVEISNREMKYILEKIVNNSWKDLSIGWHPLGISYSYKIPIWTLPYHLVNGKSYHLPVKLEHKTYWDTI